ncbi:MAG TPA: diacylglycerol kinase family protein [Baekduia sp.]|uniref:diacylglycerol/lipid kinase family protein n=1 Tax=Baekduia sp. TaxID=2600305 RepID=UPI002BD59BFA|nr:diacylglycerol kinase family protein [Baekduia sp.]HMJ36652.1 diacylglycerol kinase family protein [Baekduia sp.]
MPAASVSSLEALGDQFALNAATERKRMLVIVNPYATTVSDRLRNLVVYALQGRYEVDAVDTEARDHATALTREAAGEGYDVVVAFGGDGTVNEAANGLRGSATPLTCLPGGSTNVYARMLGIPNDIVDATEHLLRIADDWRPREVHMAMVNERRFLFSSGLGLDASVVARVDAHPQLKRRFGPYYFAYAGFGEFLGKYVARAPRLEAIADGGAPLAGVTALVQKGDPYTYFRRIPIHAAQGATLTEPTLAGVMLRSTRPTVMPGVLYRLFSARAQLARHRQVDGFAGVRELVIRSTDGRAVPLHVDGDYIGDVTEAVYGVDEAPLHVVS